MSTARRIARGRPGHGHGNRRALAEQLADEFGVTQERAGKMLGRALDLMADRIAAEGKLELRGFGVFEVRASARRTGKNPRTGEAVVVPPRNRLRFRAGKALTERLGLAGAGRDGANRGESEAAS